MRKECLAADDLHVGMHVLIVDTKPEPDPDPDSLGGLGGQVQLIRAITHGNPLDNFKGFPFVVKAIDLPYIALAPSPRPWQQALPIDVRRVSLVKCSDEFVEACATPTPWWRRIFFTK